MFYSINFSKIWAFGTPSKGSYPCIKDFFRTLNLIGDIVFQHSRSKQKKNFSKTWYFLCSKSTSFKYIVLPVGKSKYNSSFQNIVTSGDLQHSHLDGAGNHQLLILIPTAVRYTVMNMGNF